MGERRMPAAAELIEILARLGLPGIREDELRPFTDGEDGTPYAVWHVRRGGESWVLKRAKGLELAVYRSFFRERRPYVPAFLGSVDCEGESYFLMEYCPGETLCRCDRPRLTLALDALTDMQEEFWQREELYDAGCTMERDLAAIADRGRYLGSARLERVYGDFVPLYRQTPRSLCHDDLLPFNVLVGRRAVLIDWEYGGILPYPGPFARLIAHCREEEGSFFTMSREDRDFAIDYYYARLPAKHGISYEAYRRTLDYFLFYEYCEWIMLGNRYDSREDERYRSSLERAEALADRLLPQDPGT